MAPPKGPLAISHALARQGVETAIATLSALAPSELASVGLALAALAAERSPAEVLAQYRTDRFVRPGRVDPRLLLAVDRVAFASVPPEYEPLTLAPLAPLGTTSVVATASQHKIVSTLRGTEVTSDATNLLALECAVRRRAAPKGPPVALCASQRMVRAQALALPEHTAHFQLFVTVLAGRDAGGRTFVSRGLEDAIGTQLAMLAALRGEGFRCASARVVISPDEKHEEAGRRARNALTLRFPDVEIVLDSARIRASGYYRGVCFGVWARHEDGRELPLGDGGATDWLAKLTTSRKERYLVGAIGTEMLAGIFAPSGPSRAKLGRA